ncbi:MAG: hypothetical protein ABIR70_15985 [Bryobacteraceae bacterium]
MGNSATVLRHAALLLLGAGLAVAQTRPNWRPVGTSAVELGLADLATGPVERVWYSSDGNTLHIRTGLKRFFETSDFDTWQALPLDTLVPPVPQDTARVLPEDGAQVRIAQRDALRVYAFGRFAYRSDDGGRHWENITGYKGASIIGDGLRDLAVSPVNPDQLTVVGGAGVFRSLDGGRSWHGLNDSLPNLPGPRILSVPAGPTGPRIELAGGMVLEWLAGERRAWSLSSSVDALMEQDLRKALSSRLGVQVTAVAVSGSVVYAGDVNGRVSVTADLSQEVWTHSPDPRRGRVNAIWVDPSDWRIAVAVFASKPGAALAPQTILHTINGGGGWDTVTNNLPDVSVNGITADRASNAVYVATDAGAFSGSMELGTFGALPRWTALAGLPAARVTDVRLDAGQTQLWAAVEGLGLFASMAPHRMTDPRVVSAADLLSRAAAPGTLFSVMGARVDSATAGGLNIPVLHSEDSKSEIQVPYNATGSSLAVTISGPQGRRDFPAIPLQAVAPAILEADGTPLLQDERGIRLDGGNPAHSHSRVQIMAVGLGRVRPDWPAGTPAPMDNSPQVVAPVTAFLDREPVEVLRAVLWPGYSGVYLVELEVPATLQYGFAELFLQVGGQESNRVRVYIEP